MPSLIQEQQGGSHSIVGKLLSELTNSGNLSQEEFAKEEKVAKLVGTVAFEGTLRSLSSR